MNTQTLWKTTADVERLTIGKTKLGSGVYGKVYIGRIKFRGEKPKRIAAKVFHSPHIREYMREYYLEVIERLRREGAPIPRVGFVNHNGQMVQVMELFGGVKKGSKLKPPIPNKLNEQTKTQLMNAACAVVNAGYVPHFDVFAFVPTKTSERVITYDLDQLANEQSHGAPTALVAHGVYLWVNHISRLWKTDRKETVEIMKSKIKSQRIRDAIDNIEKEINGVK